VYERNDIRSSGTVSKKLGFSTTTTTTTTTTRQNIGPSLLMNFGATTMMNHLPSPRGYFQHLPKRNYHGKQELVRSYVGRQLAAYYAQPAEDVVGKRGPLNHNDKGDTFTSSSSSPFSSLWGEWHWKRTFQKVYDTRQGHWLTPVELFKPHYSHILANFCAAQAELFLQQTSHSTFQMVELGCGRGTNADLILSYWKDTKPAVYERLERYTMFDASPSLHQWQRDVLGKGEHAHKLRFELIDLAHVAQNERTLLSQDDTPTIVLGLEVLDNLPHDKVRGKTRKSLEQAEVVWENEKECSHPREVFVPLSDPLLQKVLTKVPSYVSPFPRWVPSVACGVLHHILRQRQHVAVALADFDWLPPPDLDPELTLQHRSEMADGEPIVTDMAGQDYECYLTSPPHSDILFPTDFEKLALFAKKSLSKSQSDSLRIQVQKQSDFLQEWGPEHLAKTESWVGILQRHNPLLHDVSLRRQGTVL
jgi:Putative S-adenosyl-L-methionine-dependent methyltransferase